MKIILIGIQGSGKSTQGNLLSEKLSIPYLSTGHIIREMAKEKTKMGRYIKETTYSGLLIPDNIMIPIAADYLERYEYQNGFVLDGFPRTVEQAEKFSTHIDKVIYLNVSDKEALWRLSGQNSNGDRHDDTLSAIRKRIELFHKLTEPVLDFYRNKDLLVEIDGEKSIEEIHKEILEKIKI